MSILSNLKNDINELKLNENNKKINNLIEKIDFLVKENLDLKEKIKNLENENLNLKELFVKEINNIKNFDDTPNVYIPKYHKHILNLCLTNRLWKCDICKSSFNRSDKSYFCQNCDFDLCKNCLNKDKNDNFNPLNDLLTMLKIIKYN